MKNFADWRRKYRWLAVAVLFTFVVALSTSRAQEMPALNRDAILGHLNAVITWYRDATTKVEATGLPSDAIYEDTTRNLAAEVVRLAFQSARAEAALLRANEKAPNANQATKPPAQKQSLSQVAAQIAQEFLYAVLLDALRRVNHRKAIDVSSGADDNLRFLARFTRRQQYDAIIQGDAFLQVDAVPLAQN